MILFLDTETTGFPSDEKSAGDPTQAQICQIGAMLFSDSRRVVGEINFVIQRDGWDIKPMLTEIHGIDNALCDKYGVPLSLAMSSFIRFYMSADMVVCHNTPFDLRMIDLATAKLCLEPLPRKDSFCTMRATTDILKLPKARGSGYKWPKLVEAYEFFFNEKLDCAHDAMADVRGCARVYWHLKDSEQRSSVAVSDLPETRGGPI